MQCSCSFVKVTHKITLGLASAGADGWLHHTRCNNGSRPFMMSWRAQSLSLSCNPPLVSCLLQIVFVTLLAYGMSCTALGLTSGSCKHRAKYAVSQRKERFLDDHLQLQNQDLKNWCNGRPSRTALSLSIFFSGSLEDFYDHLNGNHTRWSVTHWQFF